MQLDRGIASAIEIIVVLGAIYSGLTGSYFETGLYGGSAILTMIMHGLYRKYGDINTIMRRFQESQDSFAQSVNRQVALIGRWNVTIGQVRRENDAQRENNTQLAARARELEGTVKEISGAMDVLKKTNADLQALNQQLQARKDDFASLNQDYTTKIDAFSGQLSLFTRKIDEVKPVLVQLTADKSALEAAQGSLQTELSAFSHLATQLRDTFQSASENLAREKEQIEGEVRRLDQENEQLHQEIVLFGQERQRFEEAEQSLAALKSDFQRLLDLLPSHVTALKAEGEQLAPATRELAQNVAFMGRAHGQLTRDVRGFTSDLTHLLEEQKTFTAQLAAARGEDGDH